MKYKLYTILFSMLILIISIVSYGSEQQVMAESHDPEKILRQADSIRQQRLAGVVVGKPEKKYLVYPKVTGVGPLLKSRQENSAVFNDYIFIRVDSLAALKALSDSITGQRNDTMGEMILYINGNAMRDIGLLNIDQEKQELLFQLDRHSKYLMKFYPEFPYLWSTLPVSVTAGFRNGMMLQVEKGTKPLGLNYVSGWSIVISLLFMVSIVVSFVILAAKTNLIRIGDDHSPFSLSLTQLSFWTIVIASSFLYIWIVTEELPPITGSTLILLSVSVMTTAGARLVDVRAKLSVQTMPRSVSFIQDILKDELGYSVHRAQMFLWTVIMGIIFVASVIRFQEIPQLDESLLGLMGISSGAYVGLKTMENKKPAEATEA